jgi:hypothetical protein
MLLFRSPLVARPAETIELHLRPHFFDADCLGTNEPVHRAGDAVDDDPKPARQR